MDTVFYIVLVIALLLLSLRFGETFGRMSMEVLW